MIVYILAMAPAISWYSVLMTHFLRRVYWWAIVWRCSYGQTAEDRTNTTSVPLPSPSLRSLSQNLQIGPHNRFECKSQADYIFKIVFGHRRKISWFSASSTYVPQSVVFSCILDIFVCVVFKSRGAPCPDSTGYPVKFVDPAGLWIELDQTFDRPSLRL